MNILDDQLLNILLVEDDSVDVMNVQRAFAKNNITNPLHIAFNGVEALSLLRGTNGKPKLTTNPRIILLDINMPKMNGLEFLRELRNDPELKSISVFIMTTSNDDQDKIEAYNKIRDELFDLPEMSEIRFEDNISWLHIDCGNGNIRRFNP